MISNTEEQNNVSSSEQIIKMLKADGWYLVGTTGSHHQFKHPTKKGRVTVQHPKKDLKKGTENSILKQAGLK
nr:type II toxin-antitoxin system HicA family toxin [Histophilus somni]